MAGEKTGEKRKAEEIIEKEDIKNKKKAEASDSDSDSENEEEINVFIIFFFLPKWLSIKCFFKYSLPIIWYFKSNYYYANYFFYMYYIINIS